MTIRIPLNESVTSLLPLLGYTLTSHVASWEDVGDAENGPRVLGHGPYDEWSKDDTSLIVEDGYLVAVEKHPPFPF